MERGDGVFIPKVGGRVVILPKSFGQISLTSFLLKTMEKAVDNHLITDLLHPRQYVYRAGRSTETALAELTGILQKSLGEKEKCSVSLH